MLVSVFVTPALGGEWPISAILRDRNCAGKVLWGDTTSRLRRRRHVLPGPPGDAWVCAWLVQVL